ncbi:DNA polymerase III subunit delta [Sphingomonas bacterium]|uniref:DNA polymerase III subunit delta n=1 Tax=Sphingomonas bacterium TaxID=1895847 RepID=UPI0015754A09|nr:DNA polymerase III subunit delta [Sphingomonas bacterium]
MKASANQLRTALDKPGGVIRLFLLHGPDEAVADELARRLQTAMGADAERIDLDPATLKSDPARLADEAASLSLFGGARHIRIAPAGEESLEAFRMLLTATHAGNPVVAIAPGVRSTAGIVKLAIDSPKAMAFACYAPTAADAEQIAVRLAHDHGLRTSGGIGRRIAEAAGGDRAIMAREIEKMALYLDAAPDRPQDLDDTAIDAIGADLGDAEMQRAVDAVIEGRPADLGRELARLAEARTSPIPWLRAIARRLIALAEMRAEIDRGEGVDTVMKRHRVFFREEAATARALRRWTPVALARGLARVRAAERSVMAPGNAGDVLAEVAVTDLARATARRG